MNVLLDGWNFQEEWAYERFSGFINSSSRILVIPFAFHDDWIRDTAEWKECYDPEYGRFYGGIVEPYLAFGVSKNNISFVNYFEDTVDDLSDYLKVTDIVCFIGGLPDKTMLRLNELGMVGEINSFDGIIMGWSAGASMQALDYYIAPDRDYCCYSRQVGLSHIDTFAVQVHYSDEPEQLSCIRKFIKDTGLKVYTLTDDSAIIYEGTKIELIGNAREFIDY